VATWIDETTCIGCTLCNIVCPWDALAVSPETFTTQVDEDQCVRCFICLNICPADAISVPPCRVACPIHMDIPGYLSLCADGDFLEGYRLMRRTNALPAVLGRVCYHPCEDVCRSGYVDEAISICAVKRFLADEVDLEKLEVPKVKRLGKKVAIIGAGPAGLAAAHEFALLGYDVTILEASAEPGGMLRYGIPDYRLPKNVLRKDINYIQKLGVEIRTNTPVGQKVKLEDLQRQYNAVFIATGAHESVRLNIEGEEAPGIISGIDFLRATNTGQRVDIKSKVLVVGGGNVAVDAARVARRLGASEVNLVCLEARESMPAFAWEVSRAEEEGVKINCSVSPRRFMVKDGRASGASLARVRAIQIDEAGRFAPVYSGGEDETINASTVIVAIGQRPNLTSLGINLVIDPYTLTTNLPRVYAGGDAVNGPTMVVKAMASGKQAARYIHRHLSGQRAIVEHVRKQPEKLSREEYRSRISVQNKRPVLEEAARERVEDFREVECTYSRSEAQAEARRCVGRKVCSEYKKPQRAIKGAV
jgi:NADPH-dependent glutamate synthase beta subunit-like oxidoreductase